jgi:hypothetical protein
MRHATDARQVAIMIVEGAPVNRRGIQLRDRVHAFKIHRQPSRDGHGGVEHNATWQRPMGRRRSQRICLSPTILAQTGPRAVDLQRSVVVEFDTDVVRFAWAITGDELGDTRLDHHWNELWDTASRSSQRHPDVVDLEGHMGLAFA